MVATVYMVGPERTVDEPGILHGDILAIGDIDKSWPKRLEVGALAVVFPSDPELLPIIISVAVDGTGCLPQESCGCGRSLSAAPLQPDASEFPA